jgi:hypothetical protein
MTSLQYESAVGSVGISNFLGECPSFSGKLKSGGVSDFIVQEITFDNKVVFVEPSNAVIGSTIQLNIKQNNSRKRESDQVCLLVFVLLIGFSSFSALCFLFSLCHL